MKTIVLNANYSYLNTISWQDAVTLVYQKKVDVLATYDRVVSNTTKSFELCVPKVIRLVKMVRQLYKNKVPYSKRNVFTRDKLTCGYCGVKLVLDECTVDHIVPRANGGKSTWDNCITSCKRCNHKKGSKTLREANLFLRFKPYEPTIAEFIQMKMESHGLGKYIKEILENLV